MHKKRRKPTLSPAHIAGVCLLLTALSLGLIRIDLALLPLILFVGLCAAAPFFPRLAFFLPVVNRGRTGQRAVALTFDDGPNPVSTPLLLDLLSRHRVHAAFFVNGGKAAEYPDLIDRILREGHALGNHSYSHDNLLMLRSEKILQREIERVQRELQKHGIRPLAFRPPVCITSPKLRNVLHEMGMYAVGYSCRAPDGGNRWIKNLSGKILKKVRPEDIILLHDVPPSNTALLHLWIGEVESLLSGLETRGFEVLDLSTLIGRDVEEKTAACN